MKWIKNEGVYGEFRGEIYGFEIGRVQIIFQDKWGITLKIIIK